jgi:hypothetical protein
VSMLQGGTAAITPQAGGGISGSGAPSGYDPSVSLLNSGGGPQITPQAGGAMTEEQAIPIATEMTNEIIQSASVVITSKESTPLYNEIKTRLMNGETKEDIAIVIYQKYPRYLPSFSSQPGSSLVATGSPSGATVEPSASGDGEPIGPGLRMTASPAAPSVAGLVPAFSSSASASGVIRSKANSSLQGSPKVAARGVRFENGTAPGMARGPIVREGVNVTTKPIKSTVPVALITAEDTDVLQDTRLTAEEHADIDEMMKKAFQNHFETFGKEDLRTGRKTMDVVSKESAAAAVTAGTLLAQNFLKDKAPKPPAEAEPESDIDYKPFTKILNPSDATDPFYVEYYRVMDTKSGESTDLQNMIEYSKRSMKTPTWKKDLVLRMDAYEARRRSTLWKPTPTGRGTGMRAPQLAVPGYSLTSAQILTQFDRASLALPDNMAEGLTVIAAPPVRGNVDSFLRILKALQRINVLDVSTKDGKPRIELKGGIVLVFMSPFYAPVVNLATGQSKTSDNLLLLSHFLDFEAANQGRTFVLPENTTDNYAVGVAFHTYRGKRDAPLLNFLEPSYIYYKGTSQDGTDSILLSASATDVERSLPVAGAGLPPSVFKPKPTADGKLGEQTLIVRGDVENKHPFQIPQPHETGGSICVTKGLVKRETAGNVAKEPIYLNPIALKDSIGSTHNDEILLAIRIRYDRSQKGRAICDYSASQTVPPPMPPDQFYGSKTARTKGVSYTEVNFFESISKAERSPFYLVRQPNFENGVFSDWQNLKFTMDEASLLNGIGLTPNILEEIFGAAWSSELANFLNGIAITKCFTDTRLMLRGECETNRKFLDQVRIYYAQKNLSVNSIQKRREDEMRAEVKRYMEDLEASTGAVADFPTGDDDMVEISSKEFFQYKKRMDMLFPYFEEPIDATKPRMTSTNIIVANRGGDYKYYKLSVPTPDYDAKPFIFYDLIKSKRQKYPSLSFIY